MNKNEIQYFEETFIPRIENIGYKLLQKNKDLYKFSCRELIFFNVFLHKDFLQGICIFNANEKQIFSIHNLYLLDANPIYIDRLEYADECFYFDNEVQFIGILNCFYDLLRRNTESLITNGIEQLMKKIVYKSNSYLENTKYISEKDFLLNELKRKSKWQEFIRFTENDLLTDN